MQQVFASIITIGDELLIGQVTDTNSPWMAQELNKIGVWLKRRVAVGDLREEIVHALDEQKKDTQIVIMTGGLGPTNDDITKEVLNDYFGGKMVMDQKVLAHIYHLFEQVYRRPIIQRNLDQALVPDVCTVLFNERGSAPGMWFEKDGTIFVSLPGVPHEMKGLMQKEVLPRLQQHFTMPVISHRTLLTAGVGESFLAEIIKDWEAKLPAHIKLAYLPHYSMVRLRITGSGADKNQLEQELDNEFSKLKQLVAAYIVVDEDKPMQEAIGDLLRKTNSTMATAESCTGGYIAHLITSISGSSDFYKGSVVSYANEVKENVLHVSPETLQKYGAVSEATVMQMVEGALSTLKTDFALATSGIMGPSGGSEQKPVGTVWVAAGNKHALVTQEFHFRFDRARNIEMTAINALNLLRKFIIEQSANGC
ncbi:CinA family nicotinamide mononucleotide deamidase-related protein [Pseudoflavitalea sp. G-6-1-2]|uniref:CinA family nicotinamide mononucleotide deamidase-related protein n=1 Tax=Pseudoflavitalea sp. G-6-1-2 TaxID=2728841 RepID=UPI00146B3921|nr:CinA family nicotinamide mononucleotide deamidase-related protein [Pseudoflavitalea sp. G-6-1-2]NML23342.1 CinA family nicotinamide mononucleotide deamidase-related protein [Pseudoflavitalea sp. G-6-1-2]